MWAKHVACPCVLGSSCLPLLPSVSRWVSSSHETPNRKMNGKRNVRNASSDSGPKRKHSSKRLPLPKSEFSPDTISYNKQLLLSFTEPWEIIYLFNSRCGTKTSKYHCNESIVFFLLHKIKNMSLLNFLSIVMTGDNGQCHPTSGWHISSDVVSH